MYQQIVPYNIRLKPSSMRMPLCFLSSQFVFLTNVFTQCVTITIFTNKCCTLQSIQAYRILPQNTHNTTRLQSIRSSHFILFLHEIKKTHTQTHRKKSHYMHVSTLKNNITKAHTYMQRCLILLT